MKAKISVLVAGVAIVLSVVYFGRRIDSVTPLRERRGNVFSAWQVHPPSGLSNLSEQDLSVCIKWEGEQNDMIREWETRCSSGPQLMPPKKEENKYYANLVGLGPRVLPLLARRLEWDMTLPQPGFIGSYVASAMAEIAGWGNSPEIDAFSFETLVLKRYREEGRKGTIPGPGEETNQVHERRK